MACLVSRFVNVPFIDLDDLSVVDIDTVLDIVVGEFTCFTLNGAPSQTTAEVIGFDTDQIGMQAEDGELYAVYHEYALRALWVHAGGLATRQERGQVQVPAGPRALECPRDHEIRVPQQIQRVPSRHAQPRLVQSFFQGFQPRVHQAFRAG